MSGLKGDTPVSNNPGQFPKAVSQNPPQATPAPSVRAGVPSNGPGGIQAGSPMDKAPTFPGNKS